MWKRSLVLMVGLFALAAAVAVVTTQSSAQAAAAPKGEIQIDLLVRLLAPDPDDPTAHNRNGQLVVSNIGSSGMDEAGKCSPVRPGESSFIVDSFFDISYTNIGSSGLDGVSFQVDSFFDVFYSMDAPPPADPGERTVQTEMLSMDLSGSMPDPADVGRVLGDLRCDVELAGGDVIYSHVTILK